MSKQRYFLVPIWKKVFCTRVTPNIGKFKDCNHDLDNAKQPSTALIRDNFVLNCKTEFMENQFESENFRLCI